MIRKFVLGSYGVNLYVIYDEINKNAAIVDPAVYDSKVTKFIDSLKLKVDYIILTHGHIDHFAIDVLDIEKAVQERLEAGAVLEQSTPDGPVSFPLFSQGVKYVFLEGSSGEKVELNQALHLDATRREKNTGGWSHLGIPSTDIDISRQFYSQFGFEEIAYAEVEVDDGTIKVAFMEKDGFVLEFYQLAGEALNEVSNRSDGLIDHIAFNVDNVDKAYAELKAAGIDLVEDAPVPLPLFEKGVKYFMIRGPDGEKVEFNEMIK